MFEKYCTRYHDGNRTIAYFVALASILGLAVAYYFREKDSKKIEDAEDTQEP